MAIRFELCEVARPGLGVYGTLVLSCSAHPALQTSSQLDRKATLSLKPTLCMANARKSRTRQGHIVNNIPMTNLNNYYVVRV